MSAAGMTSANSTAADPLLPPRPLFRQCIMASLGPHEGVRLKGRRGGNAGIAEQRLALPNGIDAHEGAARAVGTGLVAGRLRPVGALADLLRRHRHCCWIAGQGVRHHLLHGIGADACHGGILDARPQRAGELETVIDRRPYSAIPTSISMATGAIRANSATMLPVVPMVRKVFMNRLLISVFDGAGWTVVMVWPHLPSQSAPMCEVPVRLTMLADL